MGEPIHHTQDSSQDEGPAVASPSDSVPSAAPADPDAVVWGIPDIVLPWGRPPIVEEPVCIIEGTGWNVIGALRQGEIHRNENTPCEDAAVWAVCSLPASSSTDARVADASARSVLVGAVSDGAGSATFALEGARFVSDTFVWFCADLFEQNRFPAGDDLEQHWDTEFRRCLTTMIEGLGDYALERNCVIGDFASTLVGVVCGGDYTAVVQVGDGGVVFLWEDGSQYPLTLPDSGEYANETCFVTSDKAIQEAQIVVRRHPCVGAALLTDGLQQLIFRADGVIRQKEFATFFGWAKAAGDDHSRRLVNEQVRRFVLAPEIQANTHDDVTLLVAIRTASKITPIEETTNEEATDLEPSVSVSSTPSGPTWTGLAWRRVRLKTEPRKRIVRQPMRPTRGRSNPVVIEPPLETSESASLQLLQTPNPIL